MNDATTATPPKSNATAINVPGSVGSTPKSNDSSARVDSTESPSPTISPAPTTMAPCRSIILIACGAPAPNAIRIPISWVLRRAAWAVTRAIERRCTSLRVSVLAMGMSGSSSANTALTVGAKSSG
jgi:hypothetical protein